jgi:uncharacterized BrkB/YihY/UPF0761 family membrane protein
VDARLLLAGIVRVVIATLSGKVLDDLLGTIGIDDDATAVWAPVRWPLAGALAVLIIAIVRRRPVSGGPSASSGPGRSSRFAALVVGTIGFNLCVTHLASDNATYGAFAGAVVLSGAAPSGPPAEP